MSRTTPDSEDPLGAGAGSDRALSKEAAADIRVVARGGAVQILGQVTQRSVTFLFSSLAFRALGASPFGIYRQVTQVLTIAAQLGLAGFNYSAMRFISQARARGDHAAVRGSARVGIAGVLVASSVVVAALVALSGALADAFGDTASEADTITRLLRLGAPYIPLLALLQVLRYCTQAYKTMVPSVVAGNIVQPGLRLVMGAAVLVAGYQFADPVAFQLDGIVVSYWASIAIAAGLAAYFFVRMNTADERAAPPRSDVGAMIRFALPQGGASLLGVQTLGLGIILLGLFSSSAAVALFAVALSLQGPGNIFLGGIVNIWAPVVADLHDRGEIARLDALYKTINRWIATFSFPVFAALMIMPGLFGRIYGGPQAEGAAAAIAILAAGNLFYTGTGPTGYVISMTGRPGVNFANSVVAVALYAGFGYWAVEVNEWGVAGMAWVDAGVTALINTVRVVEAKLLVGVQPFGRSFLKPVTATGVAAAVLLGWKLVFGEGTVLGLAGVAVAALVYLAGLRMLGIDPEERHVLDRIKKRALKHRKER